MNNIRSVPPAQKENPKKFTEINNVAKEVRSALADISENIIPKTSVVKVREIHKSISTVTTSTREIVKSRSNSASDVETKVNYYFRSENVTRRAAADDQVINDVDEVFVEGKEHYLNYLPVQEHTGAIPKRPRSQKDETRVPQQLPIIRINSQDRPESVAIRKPSQKVSLVKKLSERRSFGERIGAEEFYSNCMYDRDYFEDNFQYMLEIEGSFVYRKDFLKKCIDESYRTIVVNWLVYVQQALHLSEQTFFMAIRMFDCFLLSVRISSRKYILVGIACMWISNKYFDVHFIQAPKLFSLCNGKFSRQEIISMEQDILKILNFNLNIPEPLVFLYYFLRRENLEKDAKIRYGAMFLLEIFALTLDFSSLKPSLLASFALYQILVIYDMDSASFLQYVENNLVEKKLFLLKSKDMEHYARELIKFKTASNEIREKYSTKDKHYVARYFTS